MARHICIALLTCILGTAAIGGTAADEPAREKETIAFGGPRGVVVTIERHAGNFGVTAEMSPVSCFDEATNASVSRAKAESYALNGFCGSNFGKTKQLSRDTLKSTRADAVFRGIVVEAAGRQGGKYQLRLLIPEDGIQAVTAPPGDAKPFDRSSPLFTRYGDHEATISALGRTLVADLAKLVDEKATEKTESMDLISEVEALRAAGRERFATLREMIGSDSLLLETTEKPELDEKVSTALKRWNEEVDGYLKALTAKK
jgi:hypothetical protein